MARAKENILVYLLYFICYIIQVNIFYILFNIVHLKFIFGDNIIYIPNSYYIFRIGILANIPISNAIYVVKNKTT